MTAWHGSLNGIRVADPLPGGFTGSSIVRIRISFSEFGCALKTFVSRPRPPHTARSSPSLLILLSHRRRPHTPESDRRTYTAKTGSNDRFFASPWPHPLRLAHPLLPTLSPLLLTLSADDFAMLARLSWAFTAGFCTFFGLSSAIPTVDHNEVYTA